MWRVLGEVFDSGCGVFAVAYDIPRGDASRLAREKQRSADERSVKARYWAEKIT